MNIEITDLDMVLNHLETTSLEPHDDYTSKFTYKDQKILYRYIKELQQENQQLKMIVEEYERIGKENGRGFTITSIQQYNVDELVKCKNNWDELKDFLENNWKETQDIWFVKIINKMQELERDEELNRVLKKVEEDIKEMVTIDNDLKDIIISAFRYALGRHTYITLSTCEYIQEHSEIIDERVKKVLFSDLEQLNMYYPNGGADYDIFINFKRWLENFEVEETDERYIINI